MGGLFTRKTSVPISETNRIRPGHRIAFSIPECCDLPLGVPIDLIADDAVAGKGMVDFLKISAAETQGQVRVLRNSEVAALHATQQAFVHNYILHPDGPIPELKPGLSFETLKNKQRRYPIGVPIDLAVGHDFQIIASVVVHTLGVSMTKTQVIAETLLIYSPDERRALTALNQRREAINQARKKRS